MARYKRIKSDNGSLPYEKLDAKVIKRNKIESIKSELYKSFTWRTGGVLCFKSTKEMCNVEEYFKRKGFIIDRKNFKNIIIGKEVFKTPYNTKDFSSKKELIEAMLTQACNFLDDFGIDNPRSVPMTNALFDIMQDIAQFTPELENILWGCINTDPAFNYPMRIEYNGRVFE